MPGDSMIPAPHVTWTNSATIDAAPAEVWPWIAQIADNRGGFYSFTWIEDRVGALTGAADYQVNYTNANGINGEWQNPKRGDQMIQGLLKISDVKTGEYLLAESVIPEQFGWTWIFALEGDGEGRTRLINRTRIAAPGKPNQAMITVLGLGGSIMNRRMMNGLVAHPEGWVEPAYQEWLEAGLWLAALFIGLAAATLFLARRRWAPSLLVACAAVVAILILTFVQPAIWVRILMVLALAGGLAWAFAATALGTSTKEAAAGRVATATPARLQTR